jgi:5'-3' exonuclease
MEALGVTVWPMIEQEADDGLAAAAVKFAPVADQVVIMSPDKDMTQLYGDPRIVGYDRRKGVFIDATAVKEKFGVEPGSIPDYLSLVGDSADGIPGLPGWGAKSSAAILGKYGHLESIPDSATDWEVKVRGAEKLAETLRNGRADARLYRDLATLRTDASIPQTFDDLEWHGAHRTSFMELCDEFGFGQLKNRPSRWLP